MFIYIYIFSFSFIYCRGPHSLTSVVSMFAVLLGFCQFTVSSTQEDPSDSGKIHANVRARWDAKEFKCTPTHPPYPPKWLHRGTMEP